MKLKKLSFSKNIFFNDLKVYGWVGIIYTIYLFWMIPLPCLQNLLGNDDRILCIVDIFVGNSYIYDEMYIIMSTYPIIIAILLFRYLRKEKSYTTIHSYPYNRIQLLNSHILAGIVLLFIPLAIVIFIVMPMNDGQNINNMIIINWFVRVFINSLIIFTTSVLVGVIVGTSVCQLIVTCILLLLPMGLYLTIEDLLLLFIFGMGSFSDNVDYMSPLFLPSMDGFSLGLCIICIIILYILAIHFYNKRPLEKITDIICINSLKKVFKYGVTFCCMLLSGIAYSYWFSTNHSLLRFFVGGIVGSVVGYFISEILLQKKLKVHKEYKGLLVYIVVVSIIILGVDMDILGYETRIPSISQVKSVEFSPSNIYRRDHKKHICKEKENIQDIINLHKQIISDRIEGNKEIKIIYYLKNGKKIKREYSINEEDYQSYFKSIYGSVEWKVDSNDLFGKSIEDIYNAKICPDNVKMGLTINEPEELKELISLVKEDIISETYEEMKGNTLITNVYFYGINQEEKYLIEIRDSYHKVINWLKNKGYYKDIVILPEDVNEIAITSQYIAEDWIFREHMNNVIYIKDKSKIEQILNNKVNKIEQYDNIQDLRVYVKYNLFNKVDNFFISPTRKLHY
ncbi:MAG: DUF6449 domain-containing protein [Vallitalea sp.]|jgi:ABC-2 type transport system permease protein|nr:DUF6449 domain-containing protein [Vallitalea sp.]